MDVVRLSGFLVCESLVQVEIVERHLPRHIELTRAEPGCISFAVVRTDDPLVWRVEELFRDAAAFTMHQERVAGSEWGRVTADIERRYVVGTASIE